MPAKTANFKSVSLRITTINRLMALAHPGQSMDGIINELLDAFQKVYNNKDKQGGEVK